jgi:hypothetical protein
MPTTFDLSHYELPEQDISQSLVTNGADLCTILAALRFYRQQGMGNPYARSDEIHELAAGEASEPFLESLPEVMGTYDAHWVDDLFDRLCGLNLYQRAYNVIARESDEENSAHYDNNELALEFAKAILATWDSSRYPYDVKACVANLSGWPVERLAMKIVNEHDLHGDTDEFMGVVDIARESFPTL